MGPDRTPGAGVGGRAELAEGFAAIAVASPVEHRMRLLIIEYVLSLSIESVCL